MSIKEEIGVNPVINSQGWGGGRTLCWRQHRIQNLPSYFLFQLFHTTYMCASQENSVRAETVSTPFHLYTLAA